MTRTVLPAVEIDHGHGGIVKVNPLVKWTEAQTWDYVRAHKIPYNAIHDQNYPSLGCAPCTRAIKPGEDVRAGRWWWKPGNKGVRSPQGSRQDKGTRRAQRRCAAKAARARGFQGVANAHRDEA